jgi:predicted alpha/beta hydrolase family esterase
LLLIRRQRSRVLGLVAHSLDCIHHILLLRKKSVAKIRGPLNVVGETLNYVGQCRHRLDARVPRLFLNCFGQFLLVF